MNETMFYWYNIRMAYLLSELEIGHSEPTVKERWEWAYAWMNKHGSSNKTMRMLEQDLFDDGITFPKKN